MEGWREFYLLHPFDDYHRYFRPAALIASRDAKDKPQAARNYLQWLDPGPPTVEMADSDLRTLAAFGLKPPRAS